MSSDWSIFLFQARPELKNGHRNILLTRVKSVNKANISVDNSGNVDCFLGGNTFNVTTNPFLVREKSTYAKQLWIRSEGFVYSIDYHSILSYAFESKVQALDGYMKQKVNADNMYARIKEGKSVNWMVI